jgi:hypothetical protein
MGGISAIRATFQLHWGKKKESFILEINSAFHLIQLHAIRYPPIPM